MRALLPDARHDRGDIVIGWLTRVIVVLTMCGLMAFDGISVAATAVGTADDADSAAIAARDTWQQTHDVQKAYIAAVDAVADKDESIPPASFTIDRTGEVNLKVRRQAKTVLMHYFGPLRHLTVVVESGSADPAV